MHFRRFENLSLTTDPVDQEECYGTTLVSASPGPPLKSDAAATASGPKLERLKAILVEMGSVLVCYSGGIDSALVLAVATRVLDERAIGMTAVSPSLPETEKDSAKAFALAIGAAHQYVSSNEMARAGYAANGPDRCFHCKTELYTIAEQKRAEWNLSFIANGTNVDDFGDYRPGLEAARNAQVRSPLVEAGMNKADVRAAAQALGLSIWDKPAAACLSSRIPYGVMVTRERLSQVEALEGVLGALGFRQARVRWHDTIARIEVPDSDLARLVEPQIREQVLAAAKENGFKFATVDLAGYRTGSLNELLQGRSLKVVK